MKPTLLRNVSFGLVALLVSAPNVYAQATPEPQEEIQLTEQEQHALADYFAGRSQCLDEYQFGSVRFSVVGGATQSIQAGQTINISASVENTNDFPLPEGKVYVHVLRQDSTVVSNNWHPLVYEGVVPGNHSLKTNETKALSFSWQAPAQAPSGIYRVEFFYLAGGRYVMSGLPYTPNIAGGSSLFSITQPGTVSYLEFDRSSVRLQGSPLNLRAVPPVLAATTPVNALVALKGVGNTATSATVKTSLYQWSVTDGQAPIAENTTTVDVPANGSVDVPFTWNTPEAGAYELVYEIVSGNAAQLPTRLKFRFPISGNVPRIIFAGITGEDGDNAVVTACAVNASFGEGTGSLEASAASLGGQSLGSSAGATDAAALSSVTFTVPKTALAAGGSVTAQAKDANGTVTDSHTISYESSLLDSYAPNETPITESPAKFTLSPLYLVTLGLLALLVIIGLVAYAWQKRRSRGTFPPAGGINPPSNTSL